MSARKRAQELRGVGVQRVDGVVVERPPDLVDRLAHGTRVRGEEQPGHVDVLARQREQVPEALPG
jgi:hypothetical protein